MPRLSPNNKGFLLVETIIGITILVTIMAAVYQIIFNKQKVDISINNHLELVTNASFLSLEYRAQKKEGAKSGEIGGMKFRQDVKYNSKSSYQLTTTIITNGISKEMVTFDTIDE